MSGIVKLMVCALPLLLLPGSATAQGEIGNLDALRARSLELVNAARQEHGLDPLQGDPVLDESALAHARDMLARNFYSHTTPDGRTPRDRYLGAGGDPSALVAENIGQCAPCGQPPGNDDVESMHRGWMNSPEHRENILAEGLSRYGFGIVSGEGGDLFAVENFAGPGTSPGLAEGDDPRPLAEDEQALVAAELLNQARGEDVAALDADPGLSTAAGQLLPAPDSEDLELGRIDDIWSAIPRDDRGRFRRVAAVAGSCSGCGAEIVEADIRHFIESWLDTPEYRRQLLDPAFSALGFRVVANGTGGKLALLLLGG